MAGKPYQIAGSAIPVEEIICLFHIAIRFADKVALALSVCLLNLTQTINKLKDS